MKKLYFIIISAVLLLAFEDAYAQTAKSLFWRSDSLQVVEIISDVPDKCSDVGHNGPAVENSHIALCLYFNDSGAIDLYSKRGRGMELNRYHWYPSADAR
jgi:hypothetical protein